MSERFKYRGNLADTTLPEMLYTINRFRVPGVIEATQGDVSKRVYVRDGYVIHASSTDREDSLGTYLRRIEAIPDKGLDDVILEREITNKKLGVLLVEKGLLPPAQAYRAIREQIEAIVWSLFYWQDGQVTYGVEDLALEEIQSGQIGAVLYLPSDFSVGFMASFRFKFTNNANITQITQNWKNYPDIDYYSEILVKGDQTLQYFGFQIHQLQ